jgi:hypothetical protein
MSEEEKQKILKYLDIELKNWNDNKTLVSFYDENLLKYGLNNDFFENLYFKLKKNIESTLNKNFISNLYFFDKSFNNDFSENSTVIYLNDDYSKYKIVCEWEYCAKDRQEYSLNNIYTKDKISYYKEYITNPDKIMKKINKKGDWKFYSIKELDRKPFETSSYEFSEYKIIELEDVGKELLDCIRDYENKNNIKINSFTDLIAIKSYPGKLLGPHVDSVDYETDPDLTIIVDINDNFEGGEIYFNKHDFLLKPYAGSVLIYPSKDPYYHSPNLIHFGNKISCIMYAFIDKGGHTDEIDQI